MKNLALCLHQVQNMDEAERWLMETYARLVRLSDQSAPAARLIHIHLKNRLVLLYRDKGEDELAEQWKNHVVPRLAPLPPTLPSGSCQFW